MNSENNDELFADLFAYRFALLDLYENNEREIIIKLKIKLFQLGFTRNAINGLIYSFYNYYQIPISQIEINNANVMIYMYNYSDYNNNRDDNQSNIQNTDRQLLYNTIMTLLNTIDTRDLNEDNEEEQEKLTEEDFNKLDVIKINEDHLSEDLECSICIDKFELEQDVIKLNCNHLFHKNCIKSHLLNYNNKCPLCRENVTI
jgi:hypothetical protein